MTDRQRCGACKETKPLDSFSPSYRGVAGTWCKACAAAYVRGELVRVQHAPRRCRQCDTEYQPKRIRSEEGGFCSRECGWAAKHERQAAERVASRSRSPLMCAGACGQFIEPSHRGDKVYCSEKCRAAIRSERKRFARGLRKCESCGALITERNSRARVCGAAECVKAVARDRRLKKTFGIDAREWDRLLEVQGGRCAICRTSDSGEKQWHVDHDHVTGQVRGLLCSSCNLGIGLLQDDPTILRAALRYVERNRQTVLV